MSETPAYYTTGDGFTAGATLSQSQPVNESIHSVGRLARYDDYMRMYQGSQFDGLPVEGERRITLNYCRVFVNKLASYLLGKPVSYTANSIPSKRYYKSGAAVKPLPDVERYLSEVGDYNSLAALDLDTEISCSIMGDAVYCLRWDQKESLPKITACDPGGIRAGWRSDDLRTLLWVEQYYWLTYPELTAKQRSMLAWGGLGTDTSKPLRACQRWDDHTWSLTVAGEVVDGGPNPWGFVPYTIHPNLRLPSEFWGESDLADIVEIQKELNHRVGVFSQLLEMTGSPVVVIEGAEENDSSKLRFGPGQMWNLPPEVRAYVLEVMQAGAATAQLDYINLIYRALHDVSETPRTSFGDSQGQTATSGAALEIELQPLLHKLARKRAIRTSAYTARGKMALQMARQNGVKLPDASLGTIWPAVLPQDRAAVVSQEVSLVNAGIHPPTKAIEVLDDPNPEQVFEEVLRQMAAINAIGGVGAGVSQAANPAPINQNVSSPLGTVSQDGKITPGASQ